MHTSRVVLVPSLDDLGDGAVAQLTTEVQRAQPRCCSLRTDDGGTIAQVAEEHGRRKSARGGERDPSEQGAFEDVRTRS